MAAGLNIEQRKKLTIGVELAARPKLLLFLDEPTSGLDSQTSWSILDLLDKLVTFVVVDFALWTISNINADYFIDHLRLTIHGQAILCTIHQPSASLIQRFDRVLFLGPNGAPFYFGELGPGCRTLIQYFERNGAIPCPPNANPAEYVMEITGCAPGRKCGIDWSQAWRSSGEFAKVHWELKQLERESGRIKLDVSNDNSEYHEFAAPFSIQLWECFKRTNLQYWRSPTYIYSKIALCLLSVRSRLCFFCKSNLLTQLSHFFLDSHSLKRIIPSKGYRTKHSVSSCSCEITNSFQI